MTVNAAPLPRILCPWLLMVIVPVAVGVQDQSGGALRKVVQLLGGMLAKAKTAKSDDEISFAEFSTWCDQEEGKFAKSITSEGNKINKLENGIFKAQSDIKALGKSIGGLQSDMSKLEADLASQVSQRKKDHAEFIAISRDFSQSLDSIERAIAVLEEQKFDSAGSAAVLLQVSQSARLPQNAKSMVQAFAQLMDADYASDTQSADQAQASEASTMLNTQSGGAVDMLKKLRDDFNDQLNQKQKEEMNSKHASDMVVQDLKSSIKNAKHGTETKTVQKARKARAMALSKAELHEATAAKKEDEATLEVTKGSCFGKKQSYEVKQKMRGDEIEAIQKAVEILSDPESMGGAKHLTLAQNSESSVYTQFLGSNAYATENQGIRRKLRLFVEQRATQLNSQRLSLLAEKLQAYEQVRGPFDKIKKMITSMVDKLIEEGNQDAKREGFCNKEMGQSKVTRTELTEKVDELEAAVEQSRAEIIMLQQDSSKLSAEVHDLDTAMKEATRLRDKDKAKNKATVKDAKKGKHAVQAAISVLKDFYSTSFLQVKNGHEDPRQTAQAGGVLALLETILSDFANVRADSEASETAAAKSYGEFMADAKMDKATKAKSAEMMEADKIDMQRQLQRDMADLTSTQEQLESANKYYSSLKPKCIVKAPSYEEVQAARKAEVQSLKEALELFGNQ